MTEQKLITFKGIVTKYTSNSKGITAITFETVYPQLFKVIQLFQLLNNVVNIAIKAEDEKINIGDYMLKSIAVNRNGEAKIVFDTESSMAKDDNLTRFMNDEEIKIRVKIERGE